MKWNYNGGEYEFDLQDLESHERLEEASKTLTEAEISPEAGVKEVIKHNHGAFVKFFNILFGEGEGLKIVGERVNMRNAFEAYRAFLAFTKAQTEEAQTEYAEFAAEYSPVRAERSGAERGKPGRPANSGKK